MVKSLIVLHEFIYIHTGEKMLQDSWTEKMCSVIDKIEDFYAKLNKSVFVLDSSYILSRETLPLTYTTLIPSVVMDELWGLQRNRNVKKRAKYATKITEKYIMQNKIFSLIDPEEYEEVEQIFKHVKERGRDNDGLILSFCIFLQLQNPSRQIVLLTNDRGLKSRCSKEGIKTSI